MSAEATEVVSRPGSGSSSGASDAEAERLARLAPWLEQVQHRITESESGREPTSILAFRQLSAERFAKLGFPTTRDEAWRQTSVAPLLRHTFSSDASVVVEAADLEPFRFAGAFSGREAVFVDGRFSSRLSSLGSLTTARVRSLAEVLAKGSADLDASLGSAADDADNAFVALNGALFRDGAVVDVPAGQIEAEPIHLLFVSTGGVSCHPRTLVRLGSGAQTRVVESYASLSGPASFSNSVTELLLGDGSVLDHVKLQQEAKSAFHVASLAVRQGRQSSFTDHSLCLGAALARNDLRIRFEGEGGECALFGLFVAEGSQHHDTHSLIDHQQPRCTSRELYKGVLDGKSRGVKNGLIRVRAGAQKSDAQQTNKNLLLSREALVHSTPQLLIHADDVKCKHGSTTGQIEEAPLFYLRSRGLDEATARALLTWAFASDVVSKLKSAPIRESIEAFLRDRLATGVELPEGRA